MPSSRILGFDFIRGIGIIIILIIHRIHYFWPGMQNTELLHQAYSTNAVIFIVMTIVFFTMAGIFYCLSGTVHAISIYNQIVEKQQKSNAVVKQVIFTGTWFLILNYLQRLFLMNGFEGTPSVPTPEYPIGILIGAIRNPSDIQFYWNQITEPGTLAVVGLIIIIVGLTLNVLLQQDQKNQPEKIYRQLFIFGSIILLISPFVKYLVTPFYLEAFTQGNFGGAIFFGYFCQEFAIFPYLGYGFYGSIVGITIARGESFVEIKKRIFNLIKPLVLVGIFWLIIGDRDTALGERLMGAGVSYIELGLFLFFEEIALKLWTFGDPAKIAKKQQKIQGITTFGFLSLTIYILEPLIAEILRAIICSIWGTAWMNNFWVILGFGFLCVFVWTIILMIWKKIQYKGSIEWISGKVLYRLANKTSTIWAKLQPVITSESSK